MPPPPPGKWFLIYMVVQSLDAFTQRFFNLKNVSLRCNVGGLVLPCGSARRRPFGSPLSDTHTNNTRAKYNMALVHREANCFLVSPSFLLFSDRWKKKGSALCANTVNLLERVSASPAPLSSDRLSFIPQFIVPDVVSPLPPTHAPPADG